MRRIAVMFLAVLAGCSGAGTRTLGTADLHGKKAGQPLDVELRAPADNGEADYLGVGRGAPFRLYQVAAKALVIQIFDMYCIHCQRAAPRVNELYDLTRSRGVDDRVKIIGIGRLNSEREVALFRDKYKVAFPLFADKDLKASMGLNADLYGTPHFLVFRMNKNGDDELVVSKSGVFKDAGDFLDLILQRTGDRAEGSSRREALR